MSELTTGDALVAWMEDEGLSPFTLLKISPKLTPSARKTLPKQLKMEWGVLDLEHEGEREKFMAWPVVAEGITRLAGDGELDPFEECQLELAEAKRGIAIRLEAGGTLELACARLVIGAPVTRTRKGRPRPHHGELTLMRALKGVSLGQLRGWLGVPRDAVAVQRGKRLDDDAPCKTGMHVAFEDAQAHPLLWLSVQSAASFTVARGKWASDALWSEVWSKARVLPEVSSMLSRDLRCAPAEWPAAPPPKPAPQVWPDRFGAACAFEALTLDGLVACLHLPEGVRAIAADERVRTLGQAARAPISLAPSVVLRREGGPVLVGIHTIREERVLSFRRERACDDATWRAVWRGSTALPELVERHSRTTQSPPDPWPDDPAMTRIRGA